MGNSMTARHYLKQYEEAMRRIYRYEVELQEEALMVDAIRSTSDNDGMPHGSGISDPTGNRAIELTDKRLRLIQAKQDAIDLREEIFDTIMSIGGVEADVLIERYVYLKSWHDVCLAVNWSWTVVRAAWHNGEAKIQTILDEKEQH